MVAQYVVSYILPKNSIFDLQFFPLLHNSLPTDFLPDISKQRIGTEGVEASSYLAVGDSGGY